MRASPSLVLLLLTLLAACESSSISAAVPRAITFRSDTGVPAYLTRPNRVDNEWLWAAYAATLQGFGEPPFRLARVPAGSRALRFTWIRSFHSTVVVRVMVSGASCRVVTASGMPGAYFIEIPAPGETRKEGPDATVPARLAHKDSTSADPTVCHTLWAHVDAVTQQPTESAWSGLDGSEWLIERVDESGHAFRTAWSPDRVAQRSFFDAGVAFLKAANAYPLREHEMY